MKTLNLMVNAYHLVDLVGHYIGNHKFKLKDKVLMVTAKDIGYIMGLPHKNVRSYIERQNDVKYETRLENLFQSHVPRYVSYSH